MGLRRPQPRPQQTHLYTIGSSSTPTPHRTESSPTDPIDRLAQALSRPAAETLALDARLASRPLSDRQRLALESRQIGKRRHEIQRERREAERKLDRRRRELDGLGLLGRARHGRTLNGRIEKQERTVALLDHELERLEEQRRYNRARTLELARTQRRPERSSTRELALDPGLERERDCGIEL